MSRGERASEPMTLQTPAETLPHAAAAHRAIRPRSACRPADRQRSRQSARDFPTLVARRTSSSYTAFTRLAALSARPNDDFSSSCCTTDDDRPHRCCRLANNFGSRWIFRMYTSQWAERCLQNCSLSLAGSGSYPTHVGPHECVVPTRVHTQHWHRQPWDTWACDPLNNVSCVIWLGAWHSGQRSSSHKRS